MNARCTCRSCGDVELDSGTITVGLGAYSFPCPRCGATQVRACTLEVIGLLVTHGAMISPVAPVTDPEIRRFAAALDLSDTATVWQELAR